MVALYRQWDENGDGLITPKEFRHAMKRLGLKLDAEEANLPLPPPPTPTPTPQPDPLPQPYPRSRIPNANLHPLDPKHPPRT